MRLNCIMDGKIVDIQAMRELSGRGGRLRCRNLDRVSKEIPETVEDEVKLHSKPASESSLAYQLGMMVINGAAKAVSSVADGGKKSRDILKQLRSDLEDMNNKYRTVIQENESLKEWIAYYQHIKTNCEQQIYENDRRYMEQHKILENKLHEAEKEIEKFRAKLDTATNEKIKINSELKRSNKTIACLQNKLQVRHAITAIGSMNNVQVQTTHISNVACSTQTVSQVTYNKKAIPCNAVDSNATSAKIPTEDTRLVNVTKTIMLAKSRGDILHHKLMTSMESIKYYTCQIKSSRTALEMSTNESHNLKELLACAIKEKRKTEEDLNKERSSHEKDLKLVRYYQSLAETLEEKLRLLNKRKSKTMVCLASLRSLNLNMLIDSVVSDALHKASTENLFDQYSNKIYQLENAYHKQVQRLQSAEVVQDSLQKQLHIMKKSKEDVNLLNHQLHLSVESVRSVLYEKERALRVMHDYSRRLHQYCRGQQTRIQHLNGQNVSLRQYIRKAANSSRHLLKSTKQDDEDIVTCNNTERKRISGISLDTIREADEKSNNQLGIKKSLCDEKYMDKYSKEDFISQKTKSTSSHVANVVPCIATESRIPAENVRKQHSKRRNRRNDHASGNLPADLEADLENNPCSSELKLKNAKSNSPSEYRNKVAAGDGIFVPASQRRRLGIPMSEEEFTRLIADHPPTNNLERGDFASSPSCDKSDTLSISSSQRSQLSSQSITTLSSNFSDNGRYYATFSGMTFDLATFSMTMMREISSSLGTVEEMREFLDFLSNKANDLNNNPQWKHRHNLGKPEDWQGLKEFYRC